MMNKQIIDSIKKSLMYDMTKVYLYFKQENDMVKGVTIKFNVTEGFGKHIYENSNELIDMIEYFNKNVDFPYKLLFEKEGELEFFELIE